MYKRQADIRTSDHELVRRNWRKISGHVYPGAVVVDRTAVDSISDTLDVYLAADLGSQKASRTIRGPLTIHVRNAPRRDDDLAFGDNLYLSSNHRIVADIITRQASGHRKTNLALLRHWLTVRASTYTPDLLTELRKKSKKLATDTGATEGDIETLDQLFDVLTGNTPASSTDSAAVQGLSRKLNLDSHRITQFEGLATQLADHTPTFGRLAASENEANSEIAFYESYFSNFIEGTEFDIDEALEIVASGIAPAERHEDGHDILGVYYCVKNAIGRRTPFTTEDNFISDIQDRHNQIGEHRPNIDPGKWKTKTNKVGSYYFVDRDKVEGTLRAAAPIIHDTEPGFNRALLIMFIISEVHPFLDGNGRTARIFMNAELSAQDLSRIIIPSVYRSEYVTSLRKLSREGVADSFISTMSFAWQWTALIDWDKPEQARGQIEATNAFDDPSDGSKLTLP